MRSRFADTFNHDADAPDYDADVADEADPVRAGYSALLSWVARTAGIEATHRVLELGAGTGNLTALLTSAHRIVAVDISREMLGLAQQKVIGTVTWVHDDLLAFFDTPTTPFERVVSSYAVHHLVAEEKRELFARVRNCLSAGGRAVFGDLMFESAQARDQARRRYRDAGWIEVADAIDEEFFWLIDESVSELERLGFTVTTHRFSDLSWGICAALR
jgi:putative AdoMet-dependent methyltransferase